MIFAKKGAPFLRTLVNDLLFFVRTNIPQWAGVAYNKRSGLSTAHIVLIHRLGYEKKMQPKFEAAVRTLMKVASK